jgi:hypothetical protein
MSSYRITREIIKRTLNDRFCDAGIKTCTKDHLLEMAKSDIDSLHKILNEWESRGFIKIIIPLQLANGNDASIEMLTLIENPFHQDQADV